MLYGAKRVLKYLLGRDQAGRDLAVFPDDTFIVSYPRSGNTWTRFLLANLLQPESPATFLNIENLVPDAEAQSSRYMKRLPRPRHIKSHEYFDHRYENVIYIVRDPRDVVISYFYFQKKYRQIADGYPLAAYVTDFVNGRATSGSWGSWAENVGSWVGARLGNPRFLLLRYEDLIADTKGELERICIFLDIKPDPLRLTNTVERSSAERLREMEQKQAGQWVSTKDKRPDIPFIRSAVAGGWKSKLEPESVAIIESAWGDLMERLGYSLMSKVSSPSVAGGFDMEGALTESMPRGRS